MKRRSRFAGDSLLTREVYGPQNGTQHLPEAFPPIRWWEFRKRAHCSHPKLRPVYSDEINLCGGWRLQCQTCKRYLDGPAWLAFTRSTRRPRP